MQNLLYERPLWFACFSFARGHRRCVNTCGPTGHSLRKASPHRTRGPGAAQGGPSGAISTLSIHFEPTDSDFTTPLAIQIMFPHKATVFLLGLVLMRLCPEHA